MSVRDLKQVVLEYVDAFNQGNLDALCALFTPDALVWGVLGWGGIDQVRPIWAELIRAFGMQLQVEQMVCEGNVVAARYVERGVMTGAFRGHDPTGRAYELIAMEFFEIKDGKIHRRWGARDSASQSRQLGLPLA